MRLIDADALKQSWDVMCDGHIRDFYDIDEVENAPTVDAVEVVHGHWDEERFAFCNVCSNCGLVIDRTSIKMHSGKFNYCPNCGAKMDEVSE